MRVTLLLIGTLCVLSGTAEDFDIICTSNPVMEARMVSVEGKLEGIEELLKQLVVAVKEKNEELDEKIDELKHSTQTVQEMVKELDEKQDILVDIDGKMDEQKHITKTVEDKVNIIDSKTDELKEISKTVENKVVQIHQKTDELINTANEVKGKTKNVDDKMDELKHSRNNVEEKFNKLDIKMDELNNTTQTVQGMVKELDTKQDMLVNIAGGGCNLLNMDITTEVYRSGKLRYYKVPVTFGITMKEGAVPDTCQQLGMMAVCPGPDDGCSFNSGRCSVTPLSSDCGNPMLPLSKLICDGNSRNKCPQLDGMFSYMKGWVGSEYGFVGGSVAYGKNHMSQANTPLNAYCVRSV